MQKESALPAFSSPLPFHVGKKQSGSRFALTARRAKRNVAAGIQREEKSVLQEIHRRALQRAAAIIGGNEELRAHLGVSESEFASWPGRRELPREIFLRLVDIITDEQVRSVQSHRGITRGKPVDSL